MDYTPSPVRFCYRFPRRVSPPMIAGAPPTVTDDGVICNSRCPIFAILVDDKGKVTGGECSFKLGAIALVNFEQTNRVFMQSQMQATDGDQPPAGGKIN